MKQILFFSLLLSALTAWAQDPETAGTAGVHDLEAKSPSALGWNPAVLCFQRAFRYSFELPSSIAGSVANNAFSVNYWNDHVAGDRYLTDADKRSILDRIPDDGMEANAQGYAPLAGFGYNYFAARIAFRSGSNLNLPREVAELALYGNELNRLYSIADLSGVSQTFLDCGVGFGYRFEQDKIPDLFFGAGFHYYQGLFLFKLERTNGSLIVDSSMITGSSVIHSLDSRRGDGVGFDLGSVAVLSDQWEVGLSARQLGARLSWDVRDNNRVSFYTDSTGILVDSLAHEGYAERAFHYEDTTYSGGAVETRLPAIIQANARYRLNPRWILMAETAVLTESTSFGKAGVEAGVAAQFLPKPFLMLQSGIRFGGPWAFQFGLGGGLRFKHYELDLGGTWNGGLASNAQGIGFGLSQRLKF
ncbi:hypothetical protein EHM69_09980 [candidate division KSB1 bacterium]|nr:MAG: hypothetical protein EHM69_09980 [candidate division KSB1 bacterium]